MAVSSCDVRVSSKASKPLSPIGSIDLPDELTKAMKSTAGNGSAGGSRNGASAEGHGSFTGSEVVARKALAELYHTIGSRVGTKEIGAGHDGDANDGTLEAAHWIYQDKGMEGAIRIRLIQIGENRWTIVAFLHEA
jgi:hypothetical protein